MTAPEPPLDPESEQGKATAERLGKVFAYVRHQIALRKRMQAIADDIPEPQGQQAA